MKHPSGRPTREMLAGTLRVFLADMLILPSGVLTTAYLTRRLGPEGYGLFILAATVVTSDRMERGRAVQSDHHQIRE